MSNPSRRRTANPLLLILLTAVLLPARSLAGAAPPEVVEPPAEVSFRIVLLPDTQNYSEKFPGTYLAQTKWIKRRAEADDIKFVIHLGDIVQTSTVEEEWKNADRAHRVLDGVVPYSVLPGNHDGAPGDTALYNKYFPPKRFEKCPFYGGHYGEKNDSNYCLFDACGMKLMVLSLENEPGDAVLAWAAEVADAHKDRRVIVATHSYLTTAARNDVGKNIWNKLIRKHPNVFMVVSGHVIGVNHRTVTNDAGGKVHEILCDYQGLPNGGDGWLQTLRFLPQENTICVEAYSPVRKKHDRRPKHTYVLEYRMSAEALKKAG